MKKWNWDQPSRSEVERQIEAGTVNLTKENPFPRLEFGGKPSNLEHRLNAEEEAARDLVKPYEQLLADVHDELIKNDLTYRDMMAAHKRIASLMARAAILNEQVSRNLTETTTKLVEVAVSTDSASRWIKWLTTVLVYLALVSVVMGYSHLAKWQIIALIVMTIALLIMAAYQYPKEPKKPTAPAEPSN